MSKRHHPINSETWLSQISAQRGASNSSILHTALQFYEQKNILLQEKALDLAQILCSLGLDNESLAAALAYPIVQANEIHLDTVTEHLGESSRKLLQDVLQLQSLGKLQHIGQRGSHQLENLRKMLLAIVTDVRAVLIILAERVWLLHQAKSFDPAEQKKLADETMAVHGPLANRLGVWQLKWEIEDLCLRYLQPESYSKIAKGLASRRDDRQAYIERAKVTLAETLEKNNIHQFSVTGRVKHIYSIYKKMQRKSADLEKIYDMSALRVLVPSVEDCYAVLSVLQNHWDQVHEEFDDYISSPKPNGYRSIHTVLIGPEGHFIEVQIRTEQMHNESELGVAAHWRYKEGVLQPSSYEAKIALLRQVMEWQKEVVEVKQATAPQSNPDLFVDRIYVFTPTGDIMDLPREATPLDFAYHIHSEVGHRCRGAKVNGHIVPLTYHLQTGERVEILTAKEPNPSRDWLNPHLGYLNSPRARARLQHWFRLQDSLQNSIAGKDILEREFKKFGINEKQDLSAAAQKYNLKSSEDLLAAVGSGDIKPAQIINFLQPARSYPQAKMQVSPADQPKHGANIQILGINNLLTNIARCCKPLPGDEVIGYISRSRGVMIHRRNCRNLENAERNNHERLMEVSWSEKSILNHPVELLIRIHDRPGLLRDLSALLASEKINVISLQTQHHLDSAEIDLYLTIEVTSKQQMQKSLELIEHIPSVLNVRRR